MVWFSVSNKKLKRIFDEVIWHRRHVENREKITELISDLHDARDLSDLRALQRKLLEEVLSTEAEQRAAQAKKEGVDRTIKVIERRRVCGRLIAEDESTLLELRRESQERRLEVEVLKRVRRQLRGVGDGLLWKAVNFDRVYVYAVSDAPERGNTFLSSTEGLAAELDSVEYVWRTTGALAVLHDLTNFGRIGDLTAMVAGAGFILDILFVLTVDADWTNVVFIVAALLLVVGMVGLHALQKDNYGRIGRGGFWTVVVATLGQVLGIIVFLLGSEALNWLVFPVGFLAVPVGLILYGAATLQARVLPRWCGLGLIIVPPVTVVLGDYGGIVFGLLWVALGYVLWSQGGAAAEQP